MKNKLNNIYLLFYIILTLLFEELVLLISTTELFSISNAFFLLLLSLPYGVFIFFVSTLFKHKTSFVISSILIGLTTILFASQFMYNKFFKTYFTLYSAGNATQVFQFWRDIVDKIWSNLFVLLIILLPFILYLLFGRKVLSFDKTSTKTRVGLILCVVLTFLLSFYSVKTLDEDKAQYLTYNQYVKNGNMLIATQKLGLLTSTRLDFQKLILGTTTNNSFLEEDTLAFNDLESHNDDCNNNTESDNEASNSKDTSSEELNEPEITEDNIEKEIVYNTMDIDFDTLIAEEENDTISNMHEYFSKIEPTKQNEYTAKYKDYNLIFLTAEGFSPYALHKEVTPTLYKLVHEGYHFTNFYNPIWGVSTSDGEYVACTGLIPKDGVWSFYKSAENYLPFVMGNQLKSLGYKTLAYHNHTHSYYRRDLSHPNMGYDYKGLGNGLEVKKTWPESDIEMMEKTVDEYINGQPFHAYYMTVSGHMNYSFTGNYIAAKNKDYVKNLPLSDQSKAYISTQVELDRALKYLLDRLETAGIADKTLIALSADHYPYGLEYESINELAGHEVEKNFELYKSPFILYTANMEPVTIDKPCSSLDIIPTLSNLLGLEYDSRLLMGRDIFSDSSPLVIFSNRSFITDKGFYNSMTNEFIKNEGVEVEDDYIKKISSFVKSKFYYSTKMLENDYYSKIFKERE